MPGRDDDAPKAPDFPVEDTGAEAVREFDDARTAVTEERKLSDQVRRELEIRESVRRQLGGNAPAASPSGPRSDGSDDSDDAS